MKERKLNEATTTKTDSQKIGSALFRRYPTYASIPIQGQERVTFNSLSMCTVSNYVQF